MSASKLMKMISRRTKLSKVIKSAKASQRKILHKRKGIIKDSFDYHKLTGKPAFGTIIEKKLININMLNGKRNLDIKNLSTQRRKLGYDSKKLVGKLKFVRVRGRVVPMRIK